MLYILVYFISITKKSDMSVTVIYHAMSLSILYQYHWKSDIFATVICHAMSPSMLY